MADSLSLAKRAAAAAASGDVDTLEKLANEAEDFAEAARDAATSSALVFYPPLPSEDPAVLADPRLETVDTVLAPSANVALRRATTAASQLREAAELAQASAGGQRRGRTRRTAAPPPSAGAGTAEGVARLAVASEVANQAQRLASVSARIHMVEESLQAGRMCEAAAAACLALKDAEGIRALAEKDLVEASEAAGLYDPEVPHPAGWTEWASYTEERAAASVLAVAEAKQEADADASAEALAVQGSDVNAESTAEAVPWIASGDRFGLLDGAGYDSDEDGLPSVPTGGGPTGGAASGAGASESKESPDAGDGMARGGAEGGAEQSTGSDPPPSFRDATEEQRKKRRTAALAIRAFMAADSVRSEALEAKSRVATAAFLAFIAAVRVESGEDAVDAMAGHTGSGVRLRWLRVASAAAAEAASKAVAAAGAAGGGRRGSKEEPAVSFDDIPAGVASSRARGALIVERSGCAAGSSTAESIRVLQTRGAGDSSELLALTRPSEDEHADPVAPAEALVALVAVAPHVASRLLQAWAGQVRSKIMASALVLRSGGRGATAAAGSAWAAPSRGPLAATATSSGKSPQHQGPPSAALARFTDAQKAIVAALSTTLPPLQLGKATQADVDSIPLTEREVDEARAAALASLGDVAAVAAAAVATVPEPMQRRWREEEAEADEGATGLPAPASGAGRGGETGPLEGDEAPPAAALASSSSGDAAEVEHVRSLGRALRAIVSGQTTQLAATCLWGDAHDTDGVVRAWAAHCPALVGLWEDDQRDDGWWEVARVEETLVEWTRYGEGVQALGLDSAAAVSTAAREAEGGAARGRSPEDLALALEVAGKTALPTLVGVDGVESGSSTQIQAWDKSQVDEVLQAAPAQEAAIGSVAVAFSACTAALRRGVGLAACLRLVIELSVPDPTLLGLRAYALALAARGYGDAGASIELGASAYASSVELKGRSGLATYYAPSEGALKAIAACEEAEQTLAGRDLLVKRAEDGTSGGPLTVGVCVAAPQLAAARAARRRMVSAISLSLSRSIDAAAGLPVEVLAGGVAPEAPRAAGGIVFGSLDGMDHPGEADARALDSLASSMRPSADGEGLAADDEWRQLMMGTAAASRSSETDDGASGGEDALGEGPASGAGEDTRNSGTSGGSTSRSFAKEGVYSTDSLSLDETDTGLWSHPRRPVPAGAAATSAAVRMCVRAAARTCYTGWGLGEDDNNLLSARVLLHAADDCMEILLNVLPLQAARGAAKHATRRLAPLDAESGLPHSSEGFARNLLAMFSGLMLAQYASLSAGAAMSRAFPTPLRALATGIPTALHTRDVAERSAVRWLRSVRAALLAEASGIQETEGGSSGGQDEEAVRAWARLGVEEGVPVPLTPDLRGFFAPWRQAQKELVKAQAPPMPGMPTPPAELERRIVGALQLLQRHSALACNYLNQRTGRNSIVHFCDVVCGGIASAIVLGASRAAGAMGQMAGQDDRGSQGTPGASAAGDDIAFRLRASAAATASKAPLSGFTCTMLGRLCRAGADAAQKAICSSMQEGKQADASSMEDAATTLAQRSEGYRRLQALESLLDRARYGPAQVLEWLAGRGASADGAGSGLSSPDTATPRELAMALAGAVRGQTGGAVQLRKHFTESEVAATLAALCPVARKAGAQAGYSGDDGEDDDLKPLDVFTEGTEWRLPA